MQRKTPPANAVVIKPTPSPASVPAPAGNLAQKYAAMARDFAAKPVGAYAVQFELVCETASVTKALRDGGENVWFVPIAYRGRDCYRVLWGRYDTKAAAEAGVRAVPKSLASGGAVVKIPH